MWYLLAVTPSAIGLPAGFWGRPYRVEASSDPDTAVSQVVGIMAGHVRNAATDDSVRQYARSAALQFGGLSGDTSDANRVAACGAGGSYADAGVACANVRLSDGGKP